MINLRDYEVGELFVYKDKQGVEHLLELIGASHMPGFGMFITTTGQLLTLDLHVNDIKPRPSTLKRGELPPVRKQPGSNPS